MDALVPRRGGSSDSHVTENVVSQILTEIDGLEELHNVLIIGATNRLDIVDPAILRPGRFDRIIEVPLPDAKSRSNIFKIHTKKKPLAKELLELLHCDCMLDDEEILLIHLFVILHLQKLFQD